MASLTFKFEGEVNVEVTVTENADGTLGFTVTVLDETGSIGDLNGIFFDVSDDALVDGLSVSGDDITGERFKENGVTKLSGGVNVNGEIANEYGKFDGGVKFGTSGIGVDDIRETSFTLAHDDLDLTLEAVLGQDFAARLTSVGEEGGSRDGSIKLGTIADPEEPPVDPEEPPVDPEEPPVDPEEPPVDPEEPPVDPEEPPVDPEEPPVDPEEPPVDPEEPPVDPEEPPVAFEASDDFIFASSTDGPGLDLLDSGESSVLANDNGGDAVAAVNGDTAAVAQAVTGSNGGLLTVYSDGSVDFDANEEFDFLEFGEDAITTFAYTTDVDTMANVIVTVTGEFVGPGDDLGGDGLGGDGLAGDGLGEDPLLGLG